MTEVTEDNLALVASKTAVWQKKCRWYGGPDGGWCEYEYARRYPEPVMFVVASAVEEEHPVVARPTVPASPVIAIAQVKRLLNPEGDPEDFNNQQEILACTAKGSAPIEYPARGESDNWVDSQMYWLSTEPPIFRITEALPYVGVGRPPSICAVRRTRVRSATATRFTPSASRRVRRSRHCRRSPRAPWFADRPGSVHTGRRHLPHPLRSLTSPHLGCRAEHRARVDGSLIPSCSDGWARLAG